MHPNLQTFCGIKVKSTYKQGVFIYFLTHCLRKKIRNIQFTKKIYLLIHILFQGMWESRICRTSVPSVRTDYCLMTCPLPSNTVIVLPVLRFSCSRELRYVPYIPLHSVHLNTASDGWTEHMPYSPSLAPTDTPLYATLRCTDADNRRHLRQTIAEGVYLHSRFRYR